MYTDEYDDEQDQEQENNYDEDRVVNRYNGNNKQSNNSNNVKIILCVVLVIALIILLFLIFGGGKSKNNSGGNDDNTNQNINNVVSYKVEITPSLISVDVGNTINLSASVMDSNNMSVFNPLITWQIDNPEIASIVNGTLTGIKEGQAVVKATYTDNTGKIYEDTKILTVTGASSASAPTNISINKSISNISVGDEAKIEYSFYPNDANNQFTWVSSDPSVISVDSNGNVKGLSSGTATITVSSSVDATILDTITITVAAKEIEKLEFSQSEVMIDANNQATLTIEQGTTRTITPVVTPTNASNLNLVFIPTDSTIVSATPINNDTSVILEGLKAGTTELTVRSTNNIELKLLITVTKSSSGSSSSSKRCYCNSSSNCKWDSGTSEDYKDKQSQIPNATACSIYSNNHKQACFKDSNGNYKWGPYGNTSGYSYVPGISSISSCNASSNTTDSLTCSSVYKGESGECVITTSTNSKISSATSSNSDIINITQTSGYRINYKCVDNNKKGQTSATISAVISGGKTIKKVVACKDKSSIYIVCTPTNPTKGATVTCTVGGIDSQSQLESCSVDKGTVSKSGKTCVVKYDNTGSVVVTAKALGTTVTKTINYQKYDKTMSISCDTSKKIGETAECKVTTNATGVKCSASGATASYSNGKCTVKYNGTDAKEITVTFTASDAPTYTRKINFTKATVKKVTVSCADRAVGSTICTINNPDGANITGCTANNGGKCTKKDSNHYTVSYSGTDTKTITITINSTDLITDSGSKSISRSIVFNPPTNH